MKKASIKSASLDSICNALVFIEDNIRESISVADITKCFSSSHWQSQRVFSSVVGVSMGQYLRERRLSESVKLLRTTSLRIIDISLEFDFGSQEVFSRAFKQFFRAAPKDLRNSSAVLKLREPLTREHLEFFWNDIQREPRIIEMNEKVLLGVEAEIRSPFSEPSSFREILPGHWECSLDDLKKVEGRVGSDYYGVAISPSGSMEEDVLSYVSAVEIQGDAGKIAENMKKYNLPSGLYCEFENIGLSDKTSLTLDYIYGIWLPNSGYRRREGYDFEIFDKRYKLDKKESISRYCLPIEKRSTCLKSN